MIHPLSHPHRADEPVEVVLAGSNARLTLTFDGSSKADVVFEGIGLRAAVSGYFFDHAPDAFARALLLAQASHRGVASFESEYGGFDIQIVYANGGEVTVAGHVRPNLDDVSILHYEIATDQSYLGPAVLVLRDFLRTTTDAAKPSAHGP